MQRLSKKHDAQVIEQDMDFSLTQSLLTPTLEENELLEQLLKEPNAVLVRLGVSDYRAFDSAEKRSLLDAAITVLPPSALSKVGIEMSQFCFDDDLCNDVYLKHVDYTGKPKDTSNKRDGVFGSEVEEYTYVVERQWDDSMLAYKTIQLV